MRLGRRGFLAGAAGLTRFLGTLLFETEPLDLPTFAATTVALFVVAVLASYSGSLDHALVLGTSDPDRRLSAVDAQDGRHLASSRRTTGSVAGPGTFRNRDGWRSSVMTAPRTAPDIVSARSVIVSS